MGTLGPRARPTSNESDYLGLGHILDRGRLFVFAAPRCSAAGAARAVAQQQPLFVSLLSTPTAAAASLKHSS